MALRPDLGLHTADAGEGRKPLQQIAEEVASTSAFQNLVDGLDRHFFMQLLILAGVPDAAKLRAADD